MKQTTEQFFDAVLRRIVYDKKLDEEAKMLEIKKIAFSLSPSLVSVQCGNAQ